MNVAEIIQKFGGTGETARRFNVLPSAVSNWKHFDRFPDRLHLRITLEAQKIGVNIPPDFFTEDTAA
jgi:hypothetical protein